MLEAVLALTIKVNGEIAAYLTAQSDAARAATLSAITVTVAAIGLGTLAVIGAAVLLVRGGLVRPIGGM
ncbi:hypothetical protein J8J27_30550, partial [Mycobacterium tuberculosis]|nr:hypothetical protein [Mycobacterium tuberculosis]